jgi:hypothetical protein
LPWIAPLASTNAHAFVGLMNSMSVLEAAGLLLRSINDDGEAERCYYCGMTADSIDHVIPQSALEQLADDPEALRVLIGRRRRLTVPACRECNSLARATTQESLNERRAFVHEAMARKYQQVLATPDWSDTELMELSPALRGRVLILLGSREILRRRIQWRG